MNIQHWKALFTASIVKYNTKSVYDYLKYLCGSNTVSSTHLRKSHKVRREDDRGDDDGAEPAQGEQAIRVDDQKLDETVKLPHGERLRWLSTTVRWCSRNFHVS